jgi:UDP-N-acetylmuramyl pentapeptide synthase
MENTEEKWFVTCFGWNFNAMAAVAAATEAEADEEEVSLKLAEGIKKRRYR